MHGFVHPEVLSVNQNLCITRKSLYSSSCGFMANSRHHEFFSSHSRCGCHRRGRGRHCFGSWHGSFHECRHRGGCSRSDLKKEINMSYRMSQAGLLPQAAGAMSEISDEFISHWWFFLLAELFRGAWQERQMLQERKSRRIRNASWSLKFEAGLLKLNAKRIEWCLTARWFEREYVSYLKA